MEFDFSQSVCWEGRGSLPDAAGVYVISQQANLVPIYIGLTAEKRGLRGRISKFHRSAINGVGNHAGGRTYHRLFGADVSGLSLRYHQVEDFKFEASLVHAYVAYVESRLIWEHVEAHGALPVCNSE
ncbi:hypothetical protein QTA57_11250 [Fontisubflavum oceani]|uniref:hypothetical protein n=1 Tax=Fontisubflavum oceani TaxID=2978973 RepID=UPI0025B35558|nr:hypothetical protein [Fontisubflavum oceani]WJY20435.1 hypothetical protein QTA57_11250 [Fontisubflavum oceani]